MCLVPRGPCDQLLVRHLPEPGLIDSGNDRSIGGHHIAVLADKLI